MFPNVGDVLGAHAPMLDISGNVNAEPTRFVFATIKSL
jgi:hypothetical protein